MMMLLRAKHRQRSILGHGSMRKKNTIHVKFLTTLCPFGRTFLCVNTPEWHFVNSCGFDTRAGPYSGRRMCITRPSALLMSLSKYQQHVESGSPKAAFFTPRVTPALSDNLCSLYDSLLSIEHATTLLQLTKNSATEPQCAAMMRTVLQTASLILERENASGIEITQHFTDLAVVSHQRSDGSLVNEGPLPELKWLEEAGIVTDMRVAPVLHNQDRDSVTTILRLIGWSDVSTLLYQPATRIVTAEDHQASRNALHAVLHCAPLVIQYMSPLRCINSHRSEPEFSRGASLDLTTTTTTEDKSRRCRVALCILHTSAGTVEVEDLTCCVLELHLQPGCSDAAKDPITSDAVTVLRASKKNVVDLKCAECDLFVVHNAERLSHQALDAIETAFVDNKRVDETTMARSEGLQEPPHSGLIPQWAPINGGIPIICIGCTVNDNKADAILNALSSQSSLRRPQRGASPIDDASSSVGTKLFALRLLDNESGHLRRETASMRKIFAENVMLKLLDDVWASHSVTEERASTELTLREPFVKSCLRSTRPISYASGAALLKSCPPSVGEWILNSHTPTNDENSGTFRQAIAEINRIKQLGSDATSSGRAVGALERLLEEVPLLRHIFVRHDGLTAFTRIPDDVGNRVSPAPLPKWGASETMDLNVSKALRFIVKNVDGTSGPVVLGECRARGWNLTQFVYNRTDAAMATDLLLDSLSHGGASSREVYFSVALPPTMVDASVAVVCFVHRLIPLPVVEDSVAAAVEAQLPPGIALVDAGIRGCRVIPLDFISGDDIRQCVAIHLTLDFPNTQEARVQHAQHIAETEMYLARAVHQMHTTSRPFSVEPATARMFEPPAEASPRTSGSESMAVISESTDRPGDIGSEDRETLRAFRPISPHALIYPNAVEQRLFALSAVATPDLHLVAGLPVWFALSAEVIVVGFLHNNHVERLSIPSISIDLSSRCSSLQSSTASIAGHAVAMASVAHVAAGTPAEVYGFSETRAVLQHVARESKLHKITEHFVNHQPVVNFHRLPVVKVRKEDILDVNTANEPSVTHVLAVCVPVMHAVGGLKSHYGYVMPSISLPLAPRAFCAMSGLYDPALAALGGSSLLHRIAACDPFAHALSRRLSRSIFREPLLNDNHRILVSHCSKVSALKHSTIVDDYFSGRLSHFTPSDNNAVDTAAAMTEKLFCSDPQFTAEVFF